MKLFEETKAKTKCPLCQTNQSWLIGTKDRHNMPLTTVLCQNCGLAWTDPLPSEEEMKLFYEKKYRENYKKTYKPKPKHTYRALKIAFRRFCDLKPYLKGDILDFGSGGGEFLFLLGAKGYHAEGIEPNQGYGEYAQVDLELPVTIAFVQKKLPTQKQFDVITMFHVLEHLCDPVKKIQLLASHLKEEGKLVIEVPNLEEHCHTPFSSYHYAHLFHYSKNTLEKLGSLCGLKLVDYWTSDLSSSVTVILEKVKTFPPLQLHSGNQIFHYLKRRSLWKHYLTITKYRRAFRKCLQYFYEWKKTRRISNPKEAFFLALSEVLPGK